MDNDAISSNSEEWGRKEPFIPILPDFLFIPKSFFFLSIKFSLSGKTIVTGLHAYF